MTRSCLQMLLVATLACLLGGCTSGQTGSPDCVGPMSCACDPLYGGGTLLRVHVEEQSQGKLQAAVDELLSPASAGDVTVGGRVGGSVVVEQPCAPTAEPSDLTGQELLVLYSPGYNGDYPNCSAFQSCAGSDCQGLHEPELTDCWNGCADRTADACAELRRQALLDGVFSWAIPWADPLVLGGDHQLPRADVSALRDMNSCLARFPASPAPPCSDTRNAVACSAAPGNEPRAWPRYVGLALALVALVYGRRRRAAR